VSGPSKTHCKINTSNKNTYFTLVWHHYSWADHTEFRQLCLISIFRKMQNDCCMQPWMPLALPGRFFICFFRWPGRLPQPTLGQCGPLLTNANGCFQTPGFLGFQTTPACTHWSGPSVGCWLPKALHHYHYWRGQPLYDCCQNTILGSMAFWEQIGPVTPCCK